MLPVRHDTNKNVQIAYQQIYSNYVNINEEKLQVQLVTEAVLMLTTGIVVNAQLLWYMSIGLTETAYLP